MCNAGYNNPGSAVGRKYWATQSDAAKLQYMNRHKPIGNQLYYMPEDMRPPADTKATPADLLPAGVPMNRSSATQRTSWFGSAPPAPVATGGSAPDDYRSRQGQSNSPASLRIKTSRKRSKPVNKGGVRYM